MLRRSAEISKSRWLKIFLIKYSFDVIIEKPDETFFLVNR